MLSCLSSFCFLASAWFTTILLFIFCSDLCFLDYSQSWGGTKRKYVEKHNKAASILSLQLNFVHIIWSVLKGDFSTSRCFLFTFPLFFVITVTRQDFWIQHQPDTRVKTRTVLIYFCSCRRGQYPTVVTGSHRQEGENFSSRRGGDHLLELGRMSVTVTPWTAAAKQSWGECGRRGTSKNKVQNTGGGHTQRVRVPTSPKGQTEVQNP